MTTLSKELLEHIKVRCKDMLEAWELLAVRPPYSTLQVNMFVCYSDVGLCVNIRRDSGQSYKVQQYLDSLFKHWDKFSGSICYPVDGANEYELVNSGNKFRNPLRRELCEFILERVNKDLENYNESA